jgi:acetolactate synthase-1/2/3 large subunit
MKVSDLAVRCLEADAVRYIFGVPGEEPDDLLFSLEGSRIEFVPCRHDQGAAFIADVWGRLTGRAGVCLSTLGPGATNRVTAVADANLDKAPLVAITAQGSLDRLHHESHQRIEIVQMFASITKWNSAIYAPAVLPEIIRKAFKLAEMEKPGATHIELPEDVAGLDLPADVSTAAATQRAAAATAGNGATRAHPARRGAGHSSRLDVHWKRRDLGSLGAIVALDWHWLPGLCPGSCRSCRSGNDGRL